MLLLLLAEQGQDVCRSRCELELSMVTCSKEFDLFSPFFQIRVNPRIASSG